VGAGDKQETGEKLKAPCTFFLQKAQGAFYTLIINRITPNKLLLIA
jgi:hypothetical protein